MNRSICWLFAASFLLLAAPRMASADPCGMVPPIYVGQGTPIARIGDQNTFVFFKDGVETFVIHPGFKGKVDEFGMLIPFPAIPELDEDTPEGDKGRAKIRETVAAMAGSFQPMGWRMATAVKACPYAGPMVAGRLMAGSKTTAPSSTCSTVPSPSSG